jgi:hypothetical protein
MYFWCLLFNTCIHVSKFDMWILLLSKIHDVMIFYYISLYFSRNPTMMLFDFIIDYYVPSLLFYFIIDHYVLSFLCYFIMYPYAISNIIVHMNPMKLLSYLKIFYACISLNCLLMFMLI